MLSRFDGPYQIINKLEGETNRVKRDNKIVVAHLQRLIKYHDWEQNEIVLIIRTFI